MYFGKTNLTSNRTNQIALIVTIISNLTEKRSTQYSKIAIGTIFFIQIFSQLNDRTSLPDRSVLPGTLVKVFVLCCVLFILLRLFCYLRTGFGTLYRGKKSSARRMAGL